MIHPVRMISAGCGGALLSLGLTTASAQSPNSGSKPGSPQEPIRILSDAQPDFSYHDGALPPVVGVQNIQVMRANRSHPNAEGADGLGWTYNHAPMLCYWKGKFYLEYLTDPVGEHVPPGQTLLTESSDGVEWSRPQVAFPPFKPEGETNWTVSHQRMGFYVAPNGRLLILSFYGRPPRPNNGNGIGRAVREIHEEGGLGPIYFIRYNRHVGWNESNTPYPFYKTAADPGCVEACDTLLANRLMTQQWWEEDRANDGFFAISGRDRGFDAKALSFYHRKDGAVVGLWKKRWAALSFDEGQSWSEPVQVPTLITGGAKIWGAQTDDGRYGLAYNPHGANRWPLVIVSGDDGITFDQMLVVHGEIPYPRYDGQYKSMGPQYVRGIVEGNGNPPGEDLWLTYSVNKEDIWVSRVPLPVQGRVVEPVHDDFDDQPAGATVRGWNTYSPTWAPVEIASSPDATSGRSLRLQDEDRYDYAKAVRVFPAAQAVTLGFRARPEAFRGGELEIDLLDRHGRRPVQLHLDEQGLWQALNPSNAVSRLRLAPVVEKEWIEVEVQANVDRQRFDILLHGNRVLENASFVEDTAAPLERLCFRTGPFRDYDAHAADLLIDEAKLGDRLDGDDKLPLAVFYVDDVTSR